jgi:hypothetical protein
MPRGDTGRAAGEERVICHLDVGFQALLPGGQRLVGGGADRIRPSLTNTEIVVRPLNDVTAQPDDPKSQSQRSMGAATGRWPRRRCETNKATKTLPRLLIRPAKVKPPRFLQDAAFRSSQREGNQPDREIDRHTCNEYHADNSGRAPHDRVHGKGDMRCI